MFPISWIIGFVLPILIPTVLVSFYFRFGKEGDAWSMKILGGAAILCSILVMFLATYTVMNGFGPGVPICTSAIITGMLTGFVVFSISTRQTESLSALHEFSKLRFSVGVIIVLTQFVPLPGTLIFAKGCDLLNRQIPSGLTIALYEYQQDNNKYPEKLESLVPSYINSLPSLMCLKPYDIVFKFIDGSRSQDKSVARYSLLNCKETTYLTVPGTLLGDLQRYDLASGRWTIIDFLDNECAYIQE